MELSHSVSKALAPLRPSYELLLKRVVAVCEADQRIRALWLSGAVARGVADRGSDLDLVIAVEDGALRSFAEGWREWLGSISETVIARPLGSDGSFYCVTVDWERLDVIVEGVANLDKTLFRHRVVVFDKDGLSERIPSPREASGPSAEKITFLIEEFFRIHGMLTVIVDRKDWLLGVEGIHTLRGLLYQLFVEANSPLPKMGVKQWSAKLNPEQRSILTELPTGEPNRESVIAGHVEIAKAFVPQAKKIAEGLEITWPDALERATASYLHEELGIVERAWISNTRSKG